MSKRNGNNDLGFGTRNYRQYTRFLNKDGTVNITRRAGNALRSIDFFHSLITMSPWRLTFLVLLTYFAMNLVFAVLYFFCGQEHFGNLDPNETDAARFWDLFFFSTQTLTTVGYGYIYPKSHLAGTIAAIESMMGLLGFAIATGVLYGRFSRPRADILYSRKMVMAPYRGIKGLMFRIANSKQNELIELEAQVVVSMRNPQTNTRIFEQLNLERRSVNFLALNWTIVHPVDEKSPVANMTAEDLIEGDAEFMVLIRAINDTYSQTVYSRISYKAEEILWGHKFSPWVPKPDNRGRLILDLNEIDKTEKAELTVPA